VAIGAADNLGAATMSAPTHRAGNAAGLARRRLLTGGLAAGIAATLPDPSHAAAGEPLRRLAAKKGLVYGTTISAAQIESDPAFVALVLQQAGLVVPENDMKWQFMNRGAPGDDNFGPADRIVAFAGANGLVLRGHNLLWYHRTPHWFFELPSRDAKERAIVAHIRALAGRYRGKIHSWDVVNEPIEPKDGRPDGLRKAVFLEALGPEYLDLAYRTARAADPQARLVVNEYDIELDAPEQDARRAALIALLQRIRAAGTPVDAVGIQGHLRAVGGPPLSVPKLRRFLAEIAAMGLEIEITELDVTDELAPAAIEARDLLVADAYRRFLDAVLDQPAVKMIVTWGLSDRYSWIVRKQTHESRWRRDGLPSRPLPFDAALRPKPAAAAIAEAFAWAPPRRPG
jgi:endo-1,4-beta-xylanase